MSASKMRKAGIRSMKGTSGGLRGSLSPWGPAAVGLASALVSSGVLAQEATPPTETPSAPATEESRAAPAPQPAPPEAQYTIPTLDVQGEAESYRVEESNLTRLPAPLIDTPQTVTVVPEQVLEEQKATTVREALRNVSGITVSAGEAGRQGDSFILRGFSAQTDVSRDGVRDLGWYTRDTFNVEGVEVFFGPSAVLFGRGSTGGAINLATKKPQRSSFQEVSILGGTAPLGRLALDLNEAVSDRLQVRVNAAGQLANVASRNVVESNRAAIAPSLRYELGENTSADVDYLYQREDSVPDYGQPYFQGYPVSSTLDVPRETFYGVQGSDSERVNAHIVTGRIQHRFSKALQLTNTLRYGGVDRFARPTAPRGLTPAGAPTTVGRQRFETATDNTYLVDQLDLRGEFETGILKHTANVGIEWSRETRDQTRFNLEATNQPSGTNLPADLLDPDPEPDLSSVNRVFSTSNTSIQRTLAAYASEQLGITQYLQLVGSLRYDIFSTDYASTNNAGARTRLKNEDSFLNWRAGVVLHPMEKTSVYGMYGTSSNPSAEAGTLATGLESLEPEKNRILEVGAKADLLSDRLGLSAAVFRIEKTNGRVPNTDPNGPPQILEGRQRAEGYNVGVAGTVTDRWRMFANFTHIYSAILDHTNDYLEGQPLPNTPKNSVSLWTTYEVIDNLTLGGGAIYQSVTTVNNPASATAAFTKVPNFWRFDAYAGYTWGKVQLQLNLNNLTDKLYYAQYYAGHAVPAEGRTVSLAGTYRF
ncbi:TonB-dependent receptor [Hyalangium rubrum]|uniref:TonB-dependent siderophore receptor n=1 Tax=Hyalangium rubrum TaxID=3103134 RepID=A0ABU5GWC4_9BACT|nr:TonB-dependent siderophore receptor [Hyalangium sp. s54d21]MDY7225480.1 TonB-dependent siderophore receptor [Hyalangium sp. s54d21]